MARVAQIAKRFSEATSFHPRLAIMQVKFAKDLLTGRKWVHVEPTGGPPIHPAYSQQRPHPGFSHLSSKTAEKAAAEVTTESRV